MKTVTGTSINQVDADPGKAFFVDMLTRDLSIEDAILDLLDNCVDGALRSNRSPKNQAKPFEGFWAKITINEKRFELRDNCGGIPEDKLSYAFMHGKPASAYAADKGLPTVGIYGIGMKRAIYKLGDEARVATKCGAIHLEVPFTSDWMRSEGWKLPVQPTDIAFAADGTVVEISKTKESVRNVFGVGRDTFIKGVRESIAEHYAYLIAKGFSVFINEKVVEGKPVDLQLEETDGHVGITPFIWQSEIAKVKVFVAIGYYRPPVKEQEVDDESEQWRSENAGWTILCNHRVVAYCDKTHLTGWGDKPIPRFHTQYNAIRGIVVFESDNAALLPTTTTKRGLDVSRELYAEVKNIMKDGMRIFIDSTNKWKGETEEARALLTNRTIKSAGLDELKVFAKKVMLKHKGGGGGTIYRPSLPEPIHPERPVWIRFTKGKDELCYVSKRVLGHEEGKPSDVGEACFNHFLKKGR